MQPLRLGISTYCWGCLVDAVYPRNRAAYRDSKGAHGVEHCLQRPARVEGVADFDETINDLLLIAAWSNPPRCRRRVSGRGCFSAGDTLATGRPLERGWVSDRVAEPRCAVASS
jgi:hypothetical protein